MKINSNYGRLEENYLFADIARKVREYQKAYPSKKIIRLGIGDVTLPLASCVVEAMQKAAGEMGKRETFHGYGEESGYGFLKEKIAWYYQRRQVMLTTDEIFISDGAKSDLGNMLDIFAKDNTVLVPNPVYPVYVDTNIMDGRRILFLSGNEENGFLPMPEEDTEADLIYLCSPNNPTGAVYTKEQLKVWVDYANERNAVILFDAAYEAFIEDRSLPHSIYEIEGARKCAIEVCSLSKTAGFTGTRLGYTIIPKELVREEKSLNHMWLRRQSTKFNGVSYIVQRGAEAVFCEEGLRQTGENIAYYKANAALMAKTLEELEIPYVGGLNSPYLWMRCKKGMTSWGYFHYLLEEANLVGTPGSGFGSCGEGYFRLTSFGRKDDVEEAMERLVKLERKDRVDSQLKL